MITSMSEKLHTFFKLLNSSTFDENFQLAFLIQFFATLIFYLLSIAVHNVFVIPLFALIPTNMGVIFNKLLTRRYATSGIINIFSYWTIGSLLSFLLFIVGSNFACFIWNFYLFSLALLLLPITLYYFYIIKMLRGERGDNYKHLYFSYSFTTIITIISLIFIGAYSAVFPHHDLSSFREIFLSRNYVNSWIVINTLEFINNAPFNYYGGHIPFLAFLAAILSSISQEYPLYIYSYLGVAIAFIYPIVIYLCVKRLTQSTKISLLTAILSTWAYASNVLDDACSQTMLEFTLYPLVVVSLILWMKNHDITFSFILRRVFQLMCIVVLISLAVFLSGTENTLIRNILIIVAALLSLALTIFNKDSICCIITLFILVNPLTCAILLIPMILVFLTYTKIRHSACLRRKYLLLFTILVISIFYGIYFGLIKIRDINPVSNLLNFFIPKGFSYSLQEKLNRLISYGPSMLVHISLISALITAINSRRGDNLIMLFLLLFSLLVLMFPEYPTHRVAYGIGFLLSFFTALFIDEITSFFFRKVFVIYVSPLSGKMRKISVSTLIFLILSVFLVFSVIQQSQRISWNKYLRTITPERTHSFYMSSEIDASEWLYLNTPIQRIFYTFFDTDTPENEMLFSKIKLKSAILNREKVIRLSKTNDTLIISDPFTMVSLNAFTLRDVLIPEKMFIYEEEYSNYTISFLQRLKNAFQQQNTSFFIEEIQKLKSEIFGNAKKEIYIVVSQRTLTWLSSKTTFTRLVKQINDWKIVEQIINDNRFKLVYAIPEKIYIFKYAA